MTRLQDLQANWFYPLAWHSELCRGCYAWMPPMDLGLPANVNHPDTRGHTYFAIQRARELQRRAHLSPREARERVRAGRA